MHVLDFIFPRRCVGCKRVGKYICNKCQKGIVILQQRCPECDKQAIDGMTHPGCKKKYGLDGLVSVFRYQGVIKQAIKSLKYRFVSDLGKELIYVIPVSIYQDLSLLISSNTKIYPIPLHQERLKWRGFNQAEKLAIQLKQYLKFPVMRGLLVRSQKRTPQADISHREDRIKNAQGLFSIAPNISTAEYPSILLFDDVWTTGATMKEAAKVLKRSGVEKIWGLTIAR